MLRYLKGGNPQQAEDLKDFIQLAKPTPDGEPSMNGEYEVIPYFYEQVHITDPNTINRVFPNLNVTDIYVRSDHRSVNNGQLAVSIIIVRAVPGGVERHMLQMNTAQPDAQAVPRKLHWGTLENSIAFFQDNFGLNAPQAILEGLMATVEVRRSLFNVSGLGYELQ